MDSTCSCRKTDPAPSVFSASGIAGLSTASIAPRDRKASEAVLVDLETLNSMAAGAASRLVDLNARVSGPMPSRPSDGATPIPEGFMGHLGTGLANLRDVLETIHSELARLERVL